MKKTSSDNDKNDLRIALLRGINVGGKTTIAMADLKEMLTDLGFADVRSLLQSGNLLFRTRATTASDVLERSLEKETEKRLGKAPDYFVRTAEEWQHIVARNPFPREAAQDPGHLVVMTLKGEPDGAAVKALQAAIPGREVLRVHGREAYIVYPDGIGRSRLTNVLIEKKLGVRGTARNWNTVMKLHALVTT
ncbi:MAG: DUF1697 domain-containing protein [Myxococcota bacterium]